MPLYEYWDTQSLQVVELQRSVANRDQVPAHLERVKVPRRVCVFGTSNQAKDETGAEAQVPAGLKALSNNQVNAMVKESGMTVDRYKQIWGM